MFLLVLRQRAYLACWGVAGRTELERKCAAVSLLRQHVTMVIWFLSAGLLPEFCGEGGREGGSEGGNEGGSE